MRRYALVSVRGSNAETVERYLPGNYEKIGYVPHERDSKFAVRACGPCILIGGEDCAGWTLDDYVIPRLASGLIGAEEVPADHELVKQLEGES